MKVENMVEMKIMAEELMADKKDAVKEFGRKLESLGIHPEHTFGIGQPGPKDIHIWIQKGAGGDFTGAWSIYKLIPHVHTNDCHFDCEEEWENRIPTSKEVIEYIAQHLKFNVWKEKDRLEYFKELSTALPDEEELTKIRRRVEDNLRKNKKAILPVAKLLEII